MQKTLALQIENNGILEVPVEAVLFFQEYGSPISREDLESFAHPTHVVFFNPACGKPKRVSCTNTFEDIQNQMGSESKTQILRPIIDGYRQSASQRRLGLPLTHKILSVTEDLCHTGTATNILLEPASGAGPMLVQVMDPVEKVQRALGVLPDDYFKARTLFTGGPGVPTP